FNHGSTGVGGRHFIEALGLTPDDVLLAVTPLFHGNAWGAVQTALHAGGTVAFPQAFHASEFWPLVHRTRATVLYTLGTILAMLLTRAPSALEQTSGLRVILGLGAPPRGDGGGVAGRLAPDRRPRLRRRGRLALFRRPQARRHPARRRERVVGADREDAARASARRRGGSDRRARSGARAGDQGVRGGEGAGDGRGAARVCGGAAGEVSGAAPVGVPRVAPQDRDAAGGEVQVTGRTRTWKATARMTSSVQVGVSVHGA